MSEKMEMKVCGGIVTEWRMFLSLSVVMVNSLSNKK